MHNQRNARDGDLAARESRATSESQSPAGSAHDAFAPDAAFDVVPDWIVLIDAECTIRRANAAMAAAFGVTPDDLAGKRCHELLHGSDGPILECPHQQVIRDGGRPTTARVEIAGHGFFDVSHAPLRDDGGTIVGCVLMAHDISHRVRAEEEQREQVDYLQHVLDAIPAPIFHKDAEGRYVAANLAFADTLGVERDTILGKTAFDAYPADLAEDYHAHDQELLGRGGQDVRVTDELHGGGRRRRVELHRSVCTDPSGRPAGVVGIEFDVTEREEKIEALRQREALIRGLFETMPSGCAIYEVGGDGRSGADYVVKEMNRAGLTIAGRPAHDVIGRRLSDLWPGVDEHGLIDVLWRVWRTGDPERHSTEMHSDDHRTRWYENHVFRLPTGDIVEVYSDVTAEKRAEAAMRESEAELHAIFDLVGLPMVVMDTSGRLTRWNQAFHKALGYPTEELETMSIRDVTPPEERANALRRLSSALDPDGSGYRVERQFVTKDGDRPWFDLSMTPVLGADGDVVALIGAGTDITESRRAKDAVVASEERLRAALGDTVAAMGAVVALRDPYTAGHERRVTELVDAIAAELGLAPDIVSGLRHAASVHDAGKVAVPAEILTMPRRLSEWEYSLVQTHVEVGHEVLAGIGFEQPVAEIVLQHHERLDGSGYPRGLNGGDIMLQARILAVADVVEAMASHRPYRTALGVGAALDEIQGGAGRLYDPDVVGACVRVVRRGDVDLTDAIG